MLTMGRPRTTRHDLPPHMHQKGGMYYYVTSSGGKRKWIKLHAELAKARVLWAQLENGGGDYFDTNAKFTDRLDLYLTSQKFLELADKTRTQYECVAKTLREYFSNAKMEAITPAHIAIWMDNHRSRIQANTGKAIISNVFDIAVRHGIINLNPARAIKYNRIQGRDRLITDQEYRAIWGKADDHVRIAMDIGYLTGARIQDILDINLADISDDGLFVRVGKVKRSTKKKQLFLWSPGLHEVIKRARALPRAIRGLHLICDRQGKPYKYGTFNTHWLEAVRAAGVMEVHFHDIRAKAATDAKSLGLNYQALLGHASKAMSDKYLRQREIERVETLPAQVRAEL